LILQAREGSGAAEARHGEEGALAKKTSNIWALQNCKIILFLFSIFSIPLAFIFNWVAFSFILATFGIILRL